MFFRLQTVSRSATLLAALQYGGSNLATTSFLKAAVIAFLCSSKAMASDVAEAVCLDVVGLMEPSQDKRPTIWKLTRPEGTVAASMLPPFCDNNPIDCKGASKVRIAGGGLLVVERIKSGFACVHTGTELELVSGWVRLGETEPDLGTTNFSLVDWIGQWKQISGNGGVRLYAERNGLTAEGDTFWNGSGQVMNSGYIKGYFDPIDYFGYIKDEAPFGQCQVQFILLYHILVAIDNHQCGGQNATFTGFYHR